MARKARRTQQAARRTPPALATAKRQALDRKPEAAPPPLESEERQALIARLEDAICTVSGHKTRDVAMQLSEVLANLQAWNRPDNTTSALSIAIATLGELRPRTFLQSMLAVQMVGTFQAGTRLLASGLAGGQSVELAEWKMRSAVNSMRLYTEQLDALASLKGKRGHQKMTVRHVHVHPGGQAVVGAVITPRRRTLPAARGAGA